MAVYNKIALTPDERTDLDCLIAVWREHGKGGDVVDNILDDERFREGPMRDFMRAFLLKVKDILLTLGQPPDACRRRDVLKGLPDVFWSMIETSYKIVCQDTAHVLKGEKLRVNPRHGLLGTSYPRQAFENRLKAEFGINENARFVDWLLDESLVPAKDKAKFQYAKTKIWMTRFAAFATWATSTDPDPFWFADGEWRGYKIHVELGLDPGRISRQILLFVYSFPPTLALLFPTCADGAVFQWFKVARFNADHGYTRPWPYELTHLGSHQSAFKRHRNPITTALDTSYRGSPRPETVHDRIELSHVVKITQI